MKNNKYILSILRTLVIVLTVVLVVVVYWNGRRKMAAKRSDAVEALRVSAQSVINREGKKLRFPVYTQRTDRKDYTKRRIVIKGGTFTVTIDPLKEAQGLYPLETMGRQFRILQSHSDGFLDKLLAAWREALDDETPEMKYALKFTVTPLGRTDYNEYCLGDTAICQSRNMLGTYYVDDMYTTVVTAYFMSSSFIHYVDWISWDIALVVGVWILLCVLLVCIKDILNKPNFVFQIGDYSFDAIRQVLAYQGREISCSPQSCKLLYAFITAPDYFLSNDDIARVCGWDPADGGVDSRRRTAIHQLNKLFATGGTIKIVSNLKENGYRLCMLS